MAGDQELKSSDFPGNSSEIFGYLRNPSEIFGKCRSVFSDWTRLVERLGSPREYRSLNIICRPGFLPFLSRPVLFDCPSSLPFLSFQWKPLVCFERFDWPETVKESSFKVKFYCCSFKKKKHIRKLFLGTKSIITVSPRTTPSKAWILINVTFYRFTNIACHVNIKHAQVQV